MCVCPISWPGFPTSYVVVSFYVQLMELIFHHVVIDKIVDHQCLNFLFTLRKIHNSKRNPKRRWPIGHYRETGTILGKGHRTNTPKTQIGWLVFTMFEQYMLKSWKRVTTPSDDNYISLKWFPAGTIPVESIFRRYFYIFCCSCVIIISIIILLNLSGFFSFFICRMKCYVLSILLFSPSRTVVLSYCVAWWGIVPWSLTLILYFTRQHYRKTVSSRRRQ